MLYSITGMIQAIVRIIGNPEGIYKHMTKQYFKIRMFQMQFKVLKKNKNKKKTCLMIVSNAELTKNKIII